MLTGHFANTPQTQACAALLQRKRLQVSPHEAHQYYLRGFMKAHLQALLLQLPMPICPDRAANNAK
jgi:hypothetical protein